MLLTLSFLCPAGMHGAEEQKANGEIGPSFLIETPFSPFLPNITGFGRRLVESLAHFGFLCIYTRVQAGVPSEHGEFGWFYLLVSLNRVRLVSVVADLS